jgi:hypothetical protein
MDEPCWYDGNVRRVAVIALASAAACNALTGVGDLTTAPADASDAVPDAASESSTGDDGGHVEEAGPDVKPPRPSYCTGIVFYARLDGDLKTSSREDVTPPRPNETYDAGKYDGSVLVTTPNGAAYWATDGGFVYPQSAGTMALWFRPNWAFPSASQRNLGKPVLDQSTGANTCGPALEITSAGVGISNTNSGGAATVAGIATADAGASWVDRGWNHLAGTWHLSPPKLTFTLNGGGDGGAIHAESTATWAPQFAGTVAFFRLDSPTFPNDGYFDDVAIWSRELTVDEIAAIYASPIPIGDACVP